MTTRSDHAHDLTCQAPNNLLSQAPSGPGAVQQSQSHSATRQPPFLILRVSDIVSLLRSRIPISRPKEHLSKRRQPPDPHLSLLSPGQSRRRRLRSRLGRAGPDRGTRRRRHRQSHQPNQRPTTNVARSSPSKPTAGPIRPSVWLPLTRPAGTARRARGHKAG